MEIPAENPNTNPHGAAISAGLVTPCLLQSKHQGIGQSLYFLPIGIAGKDEQDAW